MRINRRGYVGLCRPVRALARNGKPVRTWVSMRAYYFDFKAAADRYAMRSKAATLSVNGGPPIEVRVRAPLAG